MRFELPQPVARALEMLEEAGFASYVVGGCVRDWVLGATPHDYDICTAASPADMQRVFRKERTVETGVQHGTLTVILSGMPLEITAFRVDGAYSDGRHPDSVRFTDRIEEDLSRRDFTINAMAYSPRRGIADPFGGREDCRRGVVRCVGEAEARFSEDALRILRALRFSARLGFPIEGKTARAVRKCREQLKMISRERIAVEMGGLLLGKDAGRVLADYPEVIAAAVPDLRESAQGPAWTRACRRVDAAPGEETVRWAALLMDLGMDAARAVMKELKASNRLQERTAALVMNAPVRVTPGNAWEMLARVGPECLESLIALQKADRIAAGEDPDAAGRDAALAEERRRELLREHACHTLRDLAVNGRDLSALGLSGPGIGRMLDRLLLMVVRGETPNERDALLAQARKFLNA
ncbi:MAG: tRNA nucleotidyltransferase [Clostridia bacterium]|nr:tRNA nucleotidyltransferase [Clostridia bacterium]